MIVAIVAAVAALNGLVDPEGEFYSGDALSAALASNCLLAYDVASRSYPELEPGPCLTATSCASRS